MAGRGSKKFFVGKLALNSIIGLPTAFDPERADDPNR
jgi:hypothetical protein